jgi:hypothetical protein
LLRIQSQQSRWFAQNLKKTCGARIKTPLTTEDKDSVRPVSFFAGAAVRKHAKTRNPSAAAPLLFSRELD